MMNQFLKISTFRISGLSLEVSMSSETNAGCVNSRPPIVAVRGVKGGKLRPSSKKSGPVGIFQQPAWQWGQARILWSRSKALLCLFLCVLFWEGVLGCAPSTVDVKSAPLFNPSTIKTIAVAPFDVILSPQRSYRTEQVVDYPNVGASSNSRSFGETPSLDASRFSYKTVAIPLEAPNKITEMVFARLTLRPGLRVLPPDQVAKVLPAVDSSHFKTKSQIIAKHLGKNLDGVDAVLLGLVRVYRERDGGKMGAIPAAVGFEIWLIEVEEGSVLWKGDYYEEQKPMIEDFSGFWERRGTFVSAQELARSGVSRVMNDFPVGLASSQ